MSVFVILCSIATYTYIKMSKSATNGYALLLTFKDKNDHLITYYLSIDNDSVEIKNTLPYVPLDLGSKIIYLTTDTLDIQKTGDDKWISTTIRFFDEQDSVKNFTPTYKLPTKNTDEESLTETIKPEDSTQLAEDSIEDENSEMYYEVSNIRLQCFYHGYFTFYFSGSSFTGGMHGNGYEATRTTSINNLDKISKLDFELFDNDHTIIEPNIDSIFSKFKLKKIDVATCLEKKVNKGDFIDLYDEEVSNLKGLYSINGQLDNWHTILFRNKNLHPHWVVQVDVSAGYMQSGDYALTAEQNLGEVAEYNNCKGYNLQLDNYNLLVKKTNNNWEFYDKTHRKIGQVNIPNSLTFIGEQSCKNGSSSYKKWKNLFSK
jgi:hypothetical protein